MAGKNGKRAKKKSGVVESVLVPAAASVVVTSAALHARSADHDDGHNDDGDRANGRQASRPRPAREPDSPSFLDRVATRLPFLKPVAAVQRRYGDVGGNQLASALTLNAFLSIFPLLLVALAVLGFVAAHTQRLRGEKPGRDGRAGVPGAQPAVRGGVPPPAGRARGPAHQRRHPLPSEAERTGHEVTQETAA